jgi:hypothetical protein
VTVIPQDGLWCIELVIDIVSWYMNFLWMLHIILNRVYVRTADSVQETSLHHDTRSLVWQHVKNVSLNCEIRGSQDGKYIDVVFLGCDAVWTWNSIRTFQGNKLQFRSEDGGSALLRKLAIYLRHYSQGEQRQLLFKVCTIFIFNGWYALMWAG